MTATQGGDQWRKVSDIASATGTNRRLLNEIIEACGIDIDREKGKLNGATLIRSSDAEWLIENAADVSTGSLSMWALAASGGLPPSVQIALLSRPDVHTFLRLSAVEAQKIKIRAAAERVALHDWMAGIVTVALTNAEIAPHKGRSLSDHIAKAVEAWLEINSI